MGNHELTCIKMRPKMKNYSIKIQIALVLSNFILTEAKVSDQRQCADPNCSGEDPEVFNDNLETTLNDDILPTNTDDKDDKLDDQVQNENEQLINGDGINGMVDDVIVTEENIIVEPAGKELEATFFNTDDIVVNESPEIIEKLEETVDITSAENIISEKVVDGLVTEHYEQTEGVNQIEQDQPTIVEEDALSPSYGNDNLSLEENKQYTVPDSEIYNLQNLENKEIANEDYYKESSENLVPEWLT